jgi:hypothetical protein
MDDIEVVRKDDCMLFLKNGKLSFGVGVDMVTRYGSYKLRNYHTAKEMYTDRYYLQKLRDFGFGSEVSTAIEYTIENQENGFKENASKNSIYSRNIEIFPLEKLMLFYQDEYDSRHYSPWFCHGVSWAGKFPVEFKIGGPQPWNKDPYKENVDLNHRFQYLHQVDPEDYVSRDVFLVMFQFLKDKRIIYETPKESDAEQYENKLLFRVQENPYVKTLM